MASQYVNFDDYAKNDKQFFLRSLKGELHKIQRKVEFQDGTTYHVTKSGSRYWNRGYDSHREGGPAIVYQQYDGGIHEGYYLYNVRFEDFNTYQQGLYRLNFLREQTGNQLEPVIADITKNCAWEDKSKIWKTVLTGSNDSTALIEDLFKLSKQYQKISKMSEKFVKTYS